MKKTKVIIIILLIILILFVTLFIIISNLHYNRLLRIFYNENIKYDIKRYPNNCSYLFANYEGEIENYSIYRSIYDFVTVEVKQYYKALKDADDSMISEYYKSNNKEISKIIGISTEDDFKEFIKTIKQLKNEPMELNKYIINNQFGYIEKKDYYRFVLLVDYNNDNDMIGFYIDIPKKEYSEARTPVLYSGGVNAEDMEYIEEEITIVDYEYEKNNIGRTI